jgi:signal transduction histidine kinase
MSEPIKQAMSILVVEDDPGDFGLVKAYLQQAGIGISGDADAMVWVRTLAQGVDSVARALPDVILLDLSLPDSSGLATVKAMRAAAPAAPIIVLTGQDEEVLALATLESGAQDYLVKGQLDHDSLGRAVRYARVRGRLEQRLLRHQQHLEELVKERTVELARALEAAQSANRAKGAFLANMSHEVRTPMAAIMGMTSLLVRGTTDPKQLDRLGKIDAAARHLMGILSDVLDMATLEANGVTLHEGEFDPAAVLQEVRSLLDDDAREKGLSIELDCEPALPQLLLGDPLRIKQVLINLLGNGVKFTRQGRVTLSAGLEPGNPAEPGSVQVRFAVTDTGIGIAAEDIQRIVSTSFEQADNSHTRVYGGAGLGLAISRNLVSLMGSRLEISSVPGEGSTFSFVVRLKVAVAKTAGILPAVCDAAGARCRQDAGAPTTPAATGSALCGARILVADDEMINREILRELLLMDGMDPDLATDGGEVVDLARRSPYDLILMDLQMPVMDGPQAAVLIRQIPHHAATPIVALTSESLAETQNICLKAGMNAQLAKPFSPDQLFEIIHYWLQQAKASAPAARIAA